MGNQSSPTLLGSLIDLVWWAVNGFLELMLPQVVVNRRWPQEAHVEEYTTKRGKTAYRKVRSWRWVRYPMTKEQIEFVDAYFWEYWLRWVIAWPLAMALFSLASKGVASILVVLWIFTAGWTFTGMLKARKIAVYARHAEGKENN